MYLMRNESHLTGTALLITAVCMLAIAPRLAYAAEEVTQEAVEKAAEKALEKATEKAAEAEAAKAELTSRRPQEWYGPTKVEFFIFVVDIDSIDDAQQNFTANVYLG